MNKAATREQIKAEALFIVGGRRIARTTIEKSRQICSIERSIGPLPPPPLHRFVPDVPFNEGGWLSPRSNPIYFPAGNPLGHRCDGPPLPRPQNENIRTKLFARSIYIHSARKFFYVGLYPNSHAAILRDYKKYQLDILYVQENVSKIQEDRDISWKTNSTTEQNSILNFF